MAPARLRMLGEREGVRLEVDATDVFRLNVRRGRLGEPFWLTERVGFWPKPGGAGDTRRRASVAVSPSSSLLQKFSTGKGPLSPLRDPTGPAGPTFVDIPSIPIISEVDADLRWSLVACEVDPDEPMRSRGVRGLSKAASRTLRAEPFAELGRWALKSKPAGWPSEDASLRRCGDLGAARLCRTTVVALGEQCGCRAPVVSLLEERGDLSDLSE